VYSIGEAEAGASRPSTQKPLREKSVDTREEKVNERESGAVGKSMESPTKHIAGALP
jgi:hypothetical protein